MLDLNCSTNYKHKMVKYWLKTNTPYHEQEFIIYIVCPHYYELLPWSIHSCQASIQQSMRPVMDKSLAIFQLHINSEGYFTSFSNYLSHFTTFCAKMILNPLSQNPRHQSYHKVARAYYRSHDPILFIASHYYKQEKVPSIMPQCYCWKESSDKVEAVLAKLLLY